MTYIWTGEEPDYIDEAHHRSAEESQKAIDEFIANEKAMKGPFTEDELTELFKKRKYECLAYYNILFTDSEKQILERLGLTPSEAQHFDDTPFPADEIAFRRRRLKWEICRNKLSFFSRISFDSDYKVYFVEDCYAIINPDVRILDAPVRPELVVEKMKLRPDQIDFLELECKKNASAKENTPVEKEDSSNEE